MFQSDANKREQTDREMLETKLSNQTARTNLASAGGEKNVPQLETKPHNPAHLPVP
jgi:hypothetical protein